MNFTIAGIPLGGNLSICHRLEYFDISAAFDGFMIAMVTAFICTVASPWILACIHRDYDSNGSENVRRS